MKMTVIFEDRTQAVVTSLKAIWGIFLEIS